MSYPNLTFAGSNSDEWCSNIIQTGSNMKPWISYKILNKKMKIHGYSLRNGCCYHSCCCNNENKIIDYYCCCDLYSYSLQGSNDNKEWETIHKVEGKKDFYYCKYESFEFDKLQVFKYVRFVLDKQWSGCQRCMQINQIEFYGSTYSTNSDLDPYLNNNDSDESISIIGKVRHSEE